LLRKSALRGFAFLALRFSGEAWGKQTEVIRGSVGQSGAPVGRALF
jgi:hypothetical protein